MTSRHPVFYLHSSKQGLHVEVAITNLPSRCWKDRLTRMRSESVECRDLYTINENSIEYQPSVSESIFPVEIATVQLYRVRTNVAQPPTSDRSDDRSENVSKRIQSPDFLSDCAATHTKSAICAACRNSIRVRLMTVILATSNSTATVTALCERTSERASERTSKQASNRLRDRLP